MAPGEIALQFDKPLKTALQGVEVGPLRAAEVDAAVGVLCRGMLDIPTHVAAFGPDPEHRMKYSQALFGMLLARDDVQEHMLAARLEDGTLVGVCGMHAPGDCRPTRGEQMRMLPRMLLAGPRATLRTTRWMGVWARRDPEERHWHLGPVAVEPHHQGQGIGSRLMRVFCANMDMAGEDAYLETDMAINVRFYERAGFEVIGQEEVLGAQHWFMFRPAGRYGAH